MDKLQKAQELEREAQDLRRDAMEEKRRVELKAKEEFREKNNIDVYASDDYCGLEAGKYKFYYGYEETVCPKHGKKDCSNQWDCEKAEWAFTAEVDGKEVLRLPQSQIYPEKGEEPLWYLVAGIGHFLNSIPK